MKNEFLSFGTKYVCLLKSTQSRNKIGGRYGRTYADCGGATCHYKTRARNKAGKNKVS